MFSGSGNQRAIEQILPDVTGNRKSKMAANKPKVRISQLLDKIGTPFQRLTPIFEVQEFSRANTKIARCSLTGSRKFNIAAVKPKVLISQLLDKIETPLQRLIQCFSG